MGRVKLYFGLILVLTVILSGCSLMTTSEQNDDKICIPKSKLAELNISIDQLVEETGPAVEAEPVIEPGEETGTKPETPGETESPVISEPSSEEPPVSEMLTKTYMAGELISLEPKATDADDDKITFTYSEPFNQDGKWQTVKGDEGEYIVTITASDGKSQTSKNIKIVIASPNNAPVIADIAPIVVTAGDKITLEPAITDAENDDVTISYSGWMTESTKRTQSQDVGTHVVTITASDGTSESKKDVTITVEKLNHAPVLSELEPISAKEGDLIVIAATASDEDGDDLKISYSEPFNETGKWQTKIDDAGTYTITVTASDGKLSDKETVSVVIKPANSAPIVELSDITVILNKEGDNPAETENVVLEPSVRDADGDQVKITYSGFMDSNEKVVCESDEGDHLVTVTATDGKTTTTMNIKVSVVINHVPAFEI